MMAPRIRVNSCVSSEAWQCDQHGSDKEDRWSFSLLGDNWKDARIHGTVVRKANESSLVVHWDIDGQEFTVNTNSLFLESSDLPLQQAPQQHGKQ